MEPAAIEQLLNNHEMRIKALEEKMPAQKSADKKVEASGYSGLNGGLQLLLDDGFFDSPQTVADTITSLKGKGYHYGLAAVSKALANYFMKRDHKLTRIKEGGIWKYVLKR